MYTVAAFAQADIGDLRMSDEPRRATDAPRPTPAGIWEHPCEHPGCSEWGAFGYQVGKQAARWYCREHREDGERHIGKA